MDPDIRSEVSLQFYDSLKTVASNIVMLNKQIHNMIFSTVKGKMGSIQGLNVQQVYIKFKFAVSTMPLHSRPKESSFPSVFLDVIAPDSVNWLAPIRLQEILQAERFIREMQSDNDSVHIMSPNDDTCAESQSNNKCDESINNDNLSSECEEMDSISSESEECNQHEDGYEIENQSCDSEYEFEEVCDSSRDVDHYDENECYDSDISDCCSNVTASTSSSCHPDNSHSQERICEEVFLSPDKISELLACEFDKYISISKDIHILPHSFASFGQVNSPIFDMERDIESERFSSNFGGA